MTEVETLLALQKIDTACMRLQRELEKLPELEQIMQCRTKRKEIKAKQDQVIELSDDVEKKLLRLQAEEEAVILKINELQAKLDATSDYRVTRSVTKDMEGQVKRQATIAEEQNELLERQIKIDKLADQVADMLGKVDHRESHLTADFKEKGGKIKQELERLQKRRAGLKGQLDAALASRYERLREEKRGIAVGVLEDAKCSACSQVLLTGQLAKVKKGPAIGECPHCHRILIVSADAE